MMNLLTLYFSGTGNTKFVSVELHTRLTKNQSIFSIENVLVDFRNLISKHDVIMLAYPIYGGILPFIFKDFLHEYKECFSGKKVITLCTQMLFSGDGAQLPMYELKDVSFELLHSIHINMPNNITDVGFLPSKPLGMNKRKLEKALRKIDYVAKKIMSNKTLKNGTRFYSRFLGYFGQRLYAKAHLNKLRSRVKIHHDICVMCNKCVEECPTNNLMNTRAKIEVSSICTLCYRCVNLCPMKAISIFMNKPPKTQYIRDDYK